MDVDLQAVVRQTGSKAAAARAVGIPVSTFKDRLKRERKRKVRQVVVKTPEPLTLPAALKQIGVSESEWDVVDLEYTQARDHGLKMKLVRRMSFEMKPLFDAAATALRGVSSKPARKHRASGDLMCEIGLTDLHLGKRAWAQESGEDFDVDIAKQVYDNAIEDTIRRVEPYRSDINKIVLMLGSDFFQTGFDGRTTVAGTVVDAVDTRFARVFEVGFHCVARAIAELSQLANVEAVYIPANHDEHAAWALSFALQQYFATNKAVTIDYSPVIRKYHEWGKNLLCLTHAHEIRLNTLPSVVASEAREAWGRCPFREIHVGHYHRKRQTEILSLDEQYGVVLRILSALSAHDAWHLKQGYVGARRACESFLFDKAEGLVASFNVNARPSQH